MGVDPQIGNCCVTTNSVTTLVTLYLSNLFCEHEVLPKKISSLIRLSDEHLLLGFERGAGASLSLHPIITRERLKQAITAPTVTNLPSDVANIVVSYIRGDQVRPLTASPTALLPAIARPLDSSLSTARTAAARSSASSASSGLFVARQPSALEQTKLAVFESVVKPYITNHPLATVRANEVAHFVSELNSAKSLIDIENALINAVKKIRTPVHHSDGSISYKYGATLWGWHWGSYKNSDLCTLIQAALSKINPDRNLDEESKPEPSNSNASSLPTAPGRPGSSR